MIKSVTVRVPATCANLGPGFDCLGLALDLWNETIFSLEGNGLTVVISEEGSQELPIDATNLIIKSAQAVFDRFHYNPEPGLLVRCYNQIPLSSGLGSSAAALVTGVLGANTLLGSPMSEREIIELLTEAEGHGDNVSPAVLGGLVIVSGAGQEVQYRKVWDGMVGGDRLQAAVVLPEIHLSTIEARALLPETVQLKDAVFNIQHAAMVLNAFTSGDLELLGDAMQDRLHQPYRLEKIPGGSDVIQTSRQAGAAASVLSGAGPSIIAFGLEDMQSVADAMQDCFQKHHLQSRAYLVGVSDCGAEVTYEVDD
jgi:homoserine kinase